MKHKLSAIILAGGESRRMEYNKEYIKVQDKYLVHTQIKTLNSLFEEVVVVTNNPEHYKNQDVVITTDILNGKTPIIGLHAGLLASQFEYSFVIACDMPNIDPDFIKYLVTKIDNHDAYVAKHNGYIEPFNALYKKTITPRIEEFITNKKFGFQTMVNRLNSSYIEEKDLVSFLKNNIFKNINKESELYEITTDLSCPYQKITMDKIVNNEQFEIEDKVVTEYPLSLYINKELYITLMITPQNIEFMIYGFLNAEMLISKVTDVLDLQINLKAHKAYVILVDQSIKFSKHKADILSSACGASPIIKEKLDNLVISTLTNNKIISTKKIFEYIQNFNHESILFKETGGVHSVSIVHNSQTKLFEDIGRHNAVDKAVGFLMKNNIDSSEVYLLTSGRISSDILLKCALAKISIIISRSAPTSLSIKLAQQLGITVVGFTRGNKMNIYTNKHRISLL
ncbi:MAG: formate dehydrogenase accessory sulfurtransferase FdhD [Candidatus Izemoplasma sp.]